MSAFLMNKKNLSSLAYEIFKRGKYNTSLQQAFEAEDINGPEDLFVALRKANLMPDTVTNRGLMMTLANTISTTQNSIFPTS